MNKIKYIVLILFGACNGTNLLGQNIPPDTVIVKRNIDNSGMSVDTFYIPGGRSSTQVLVGTTFLPYSDKMIQLLNKGLSPISFEILKECEGSIEPWRLKDYPNFIQVKRDSNLLTIDVEVIANCCHQFLGEAEIMGANTLNLLFTSYGGFCACACCFTLRYIFDTTMEKNYQVLRFVSINNDKESIAEIPDQ